MNSVQEIPFRVSARTARLIGRENVATAESAISELVKNAYDADATFCLVHISAVYDGVPEVITKDEFELLASWGLQPDDHYELNGPEAALRPCLRDKHSPEAKLVRNLVNVTVTDDGAGMNEASIRDDWMVIGTANKEKVSSSKLGRTRTGAKGIGRFALEKLGAKCELHSSSQDEDDNAETLTWAVDWTAFEEDGAVLDQVTATLQIGTAGFQNTLEAMRKVAGLQAFADSAISRATGVTICISEIRDHWSEDALRKLRRALGVLAPPDEQRGINFILNRLAIVCGAVYDFINGAVPQILFSYHAISVFDHTLTTFFLNNGQCRGYCLCNRHF